MLHATLPRRAPAVDARSVVLVVLGALSTAAWIMTQSSGRSDVRLILLATGLVCWLWAYGRITHGAKLPPRLVLLAGSVVMVVAVATPPSASRDVWSYVMYGRIVDVHHADPYEVAPSAYPEDPFQQRVAHGWRGARSVYGPVFTGVSAAGAAVSGDSPLRNRLVHQGLAGGAVLALMLWYHRRSGDGASILLLGASPPVVAAVNAGHNDILVGALLLGGAVTLARRRPVVGGAVVAAAALIKLVALLPAALLVGWVWRRQGWRAAAGFSAAVASLTIGIYLAFGGVDTIRPLVEAGGRSSRASTSSTLRPVVAPFLPGEASVADTSRLLAVAAMAVLFLLAARLAWSLLSSADTGPAPIAAAACLVFLVAWPYVLPSYAMWALVLASATPRAWSTRAAMAASSALLLAYVDRPGTAPSNAVLVAFARGAPLVAIVIWVGLELQARPSAESATAEPPGPDPDPVLSPSSAGAQVERVMMPASPRR